MIDYLYSNYSPNFDKISHLRLKQMSSLRLEQRIKRFLNVQIKESNIKIIIFKMGQLE